jgi:hypothetical protein
MGSDPLKVHQCAEEPCWIEKHLPLPSSWRAGGTAAGALGARRALLEMPVQLRLRKADGIPRNTRLRRPGEGWLAGAFRL